MSWEIWETASGTRAELQQVHTAVIQEVGGAVSTWSHHLVLVDNLDRLVINSQPAVKPNLEDVCGVVATCSAVAMMVDHCEQPIGSVAFKVFIFDAWRKQFSCLVLVV